MRLKNCYPVEGGEEQKIVPRSSRCSLWQGVHTSVLSYS